MHILQYLICGRKGRGTFRISHKFDARLQLDHRLNACVYVCKDYTEFKRLNEELVGQFNKNGLWSAVQVMDTETGIATDPTPELMVEQDAEAVLAKEQENKTLKDQVEKLTADLAARDELIRAAMSPAQPQGGAEVARLTHTQEVASSSLAPATTEQPPLPAAPEPPARKKSAKK